jgi:hypothetical protein
MGNFRITINAVGGHGQDRNKKDGEIVDFDADRADGLSPEAIVKKAVEELQQHGNSVTEATVHHWPGSGNDVVDNLLTGKRKGNF